MQADCKRYESSLKMHSVNNIQLIGKVIYEPVLEETAHTRFLLVRLLTYNLYHIGTQYKAENETHSLRLYGSKINNYIQEIEPADVIYVEGSIKTYQKLKHIHVTKIRILVKRSPDDLLPPDVTIKPTFKTGDE